MTRDYSALVKDDRVHTALYTDPAIFEDEIDRIFNTTWVWVAHDSELPNKNDWITTHVGRQPVIVNRDKAGTVRVMLNRCRHRGATICEAKKGNAPGFVCPYHAWTYGTDGTLKGLPLPKGYKDFDKGDYTLVNLRAESYRGLIFATFNQDAPPLEEFLGRARPWIDLFLKQGGGYPVKVLGEHKFTFPGNWKIQLENTTDAYHFPIVHKSFLSSLDGDTGELFSFMDAGGYVEDLGNGHSVMVMIPELVDLEENLDEPIPERFAELADELRAEHSEDEVRRIVRAVTGSGFNVNLFPNLACSMAFFRVLRPLSVEETEVRHIAIGMDGGPAAANRARLRLHEHFQGPMGFGTPDDAEAWERVQRGSQAGEDSVWIMLNRGEDKTESNAGDVTAETGMRAAYQMWKRMMTA
ncbi:MAG: aromatic ring-hydroxylating dioxygenase subunit alpha [Novosphingobium sp.]|jgi:phenylpropionate dioxygenase-like ring-hydroxylating dioxygenase large terminal subunit|uniref:aromatic ring-hydroxylating oxygenase subunit alpha n=1 Tax=Novosphingobium sp. TaxID=1874826 RepID=UPI0022BB8AA2|nr:aromatic ring-hydroxylating dioxygenase subunit alpha [Novosphingobium sp.]MCE2841632.1 aromatic ring-hydroxylating dioxygenase subunit alpha [Novosphingobium sp.]MCZ8018466.1 aromatic ring-hydroxylating dioxygenase subunit alpha [Novosphingobium sp.]MCZ8033460.1 aromatic ring-hydroxylating dioxygenase subunit alpha [Novosphingobium sp.]MCZ8051915.1 aromatic ring-hydroxylating dioxygenase subunit alpha [Novosphingobium sp.]MCZ8060457.1 aromatic ring-hydroxylating dioxygenase subunit alpha [